MLLNPRISVTRQGNIAEDGLHIDGEARGPEGMECGEINKMMPVRFYKHGKRPWEILFFPRAFRFTWSLKS